mgnify:CR=1 FL=1
MNGQDKILERLGLFRPLCLIIEAFIRMQPAGVRFNSQQLARALSTNPTIIRINGYLAVAGYSRRLCIESFLGSAAAYRSRSGGIVKYHKIGRKSLFSN